MAKISKDLRFKGLPASNNRQDDGTAVSGTTSYRPSILIYKVPMSLSSHARPRETRYYIPKVEGSNSLLELPNTFLQ